MTRPFREEDDRQINALLRDHLAAELDGRVGRARQAFETRMALQPARRRVRWLDESHRWMIATFGSAIAATVAGFWVVPHIWNHHTPTAGRNVTPANYYIAKPSAMPASAMAEATPQWEETQKIVSSGAQDNGVVVLDNNTPARVVRNVSMERTEWVDPRQGVRVEVVVPREKLMLINMDTY